jgi:hypothetical protein
MHILFNYVPNHFPIVIIIIIIIIHPSIHIFKILFIDYNNNNHSL